MAQTLDAKQFWPILGEHFIEILLFFINYSLTGSNGMGKIAPVLWGIQQGFQNIWTGSVAS